MAINPGKQLSLTFSRYGIGNYLQGGVKKFHQDMTSGPKVPFMRLHDPDTNFIISKTGSPLKYFQPEIPKMDIETIKKIVESSIQNFLRLREKLLQNSKDFDLILFSSGAIQVARVEGRKSLIYTSEVLSTEIVNLSEKLKSGINEVGGKVNKISEDLPLESVKEKWKLIKEKLPEWQSNIATKLQAIQEIINKKFNFDKTK